MRSRKSSGNPGTPARKISFIGAWGFWQAVETRAMRSGRVALVLVLMLTLAFVAYAMTGPGNAADGPQTGQLVGDARLLLTTSSGGLATAASDARPAAATAASPQDQPSNRLAPGFQGRVAVIQPVFTSTAYHEYYKHATPDASSQGWGSFYIFYASNYHQTGNITQDLWMLSLPVSSGLSYFGGWGQDAGLQGLVNGSGLPPRDVSVLTDMEVDGGALFGPGGA